MMKVQEYLKEHGLQALVDGYSIKAKEQGNLVALNYDQIDSPKADPITRECRGLILDMRDWSVVSRSFDRFFNWGESGCPEGVDLYHGKVYEKIDGSLIKLYYYEGEWHISTRGTVVADGPVGMFGDITFQDLVVKASPVDTLEEFKELCEKHLYPENTYILEITSQENRVVKRYEGYNLYFLACRNNETGQYMDMLPSVKQAMGFLSPKEINCLSMEGVVEASQGMKDLDEGWVVYESGVPVCKVKSPLYLAVHRIRGEGVITPKRVMQLLLVNEQDEYLTYFPEDEKFFTPYREALRQLLYSMDCLYKLVGDIQDQKVYALEVKDTIYQACMFMAKKQGVLPSKVFMAQKESYQMKVLEVYKEELLV